MKIPFIKKEEIIKLNNDPVIELLHMYLKEYKELEEADRNIIRSVLKLYLPKEK